MRLFAAIALTVLTLVVSAADYPDRPVRFVVPYAPGGGSDIIARVVGLKLGEALANRSWSITGPAPPVWSPLRSSQNRCPTATR